MHERHGLGGELRRELTGPNQSTLYLTHRGGESKRIHGRILGKMLNMPAVAHIPQDRCGRGAQDVGDATQQSHQPGGRPS